MRYEPHITVVRTGKDIVKNKEFWGKYEGELITFKYSPIVDCDDKRFWLNVYSVRLEEIRLELGLVVDSLFKATPEGFKKTFHTTIAKRMCYVN